MRYFDGQAFASCNDGSLTVVGMRVGKFEVEQRLQTAQGARTMDLNQQSRQIFLPTASLERRTGGKPRVKPGSFKIVVVAQQYPEDTDSLNHSHVPSVQKLDLDGNHVARNDRYAVVEEGLSGSLSPDGTTYTGPAPTEKQVQKGESVMSHVDCNTAPFLWDYADCFVLFDNFFDTVIGPSTPNVIAMIAGQSGLTQWGEHPNIAMGTVSANLPSPYTGHSNAVVPVTGDPQPFWGNSLAPLVENTPPSQPTEGGGSPTSNSAPNQTFATLALSFMGDQIHGITAQDMNPAFDLMDVQGDIEKIAGDHNKPVNWAWYEDGYDHEPTDGNGPATYSHYIAHHDAPQYFGHEANNPTETAAHLKGLGDFYTAIKNNALPKDGGVFYVRGAYGNIDGLIPRSPSPAVKADFQGNDDHPAYSDAQISEALLADSINAIARSRYWPESAIIITYDETDGLYDHTQPKIRSFDPQGNAIDQGPRIPTIMISPYSYAHAISHEATEHGSVIDELFKLTPLADLPDEAAARKLGEINYDQKYLGPSDDQTPGVGDLFSAFDNARLVGNSIAHLSKSAARRIAKARGYLHSFPASVTNGTSPERTDQTQRFSATHRLGGRQWTHRQLGHGSAIFGGCS